MQSKAKNVDDYLKEVPADRLEALNRIRELCLTELKGYRETMAYGGPCYFKNDVAEAGFASQQHFIGLYILEKDVLDQYRDQLKGRGISIGKGCIRYSKPYKINFELVKKLLKGTCDSKSIICG
ncbi:MAG: DUF1801 domain-containing protein [Ferruginibacter sp.]